MIKDSVVTGVKIHQPELVNIYDSIIGSGSSIGAFVEIADSIIGQHCNIQAHVSISGGTEIGDDVFIGPGVRFCNVKKPNPYQKAGCYNGAIVEFGVVIGAGAIILPGVVIGVKSIIGAGSVVTKDVGFGETVVGNPAKRIGPSYLAS